MKSAVLILSAMIAAGTTGCQKSDGTSEPNSPPAKTSQPPPNPTTPQQSETENKNPSQATNDQSQQVTKRADQQNAPGQVQKSPTLAQVEAALPPPSPQDTVGGQLLVGYLRGNIPGEDVVKQTFDEPTYFTSDLAEMSMAVKQLKKNGKFTAADKENVQTLDGAMTQFLNERRQQDERLGQVVEYGSAAAIGIVGGVYSSEVITGLQRFGSWSWPVIQYPINGIRYIYQSLKGGAQNIAAWLDRSGSATASSDTITSVSKSHELYKRAMRAVGLRGTSASPKELVQAHLAKVLSNRELTNGFEVNSLDGWEREAAARLRYYRTGVSGLRINQHEGDDFLTARIFDSQGDPQYFKITGSTVSTVTEDGHKMVVPRDTMIRLLTKRLRNWGEGTVTFVSSNGRKIYTGVAGSRVVQYVANSPRVKKALAGTAVGVPTAALTLLALQPLDLRYLAIEDFVKDLSEDGIHIENFLDQQLEEAQVAARIPRNDP